MHRRIVEDGHSLEINRSAEISTATVIALPRMTLQVCAIPRNILMTFWVGKGEKIQRVTETQSNPE